MQRIIRIEDFVPAKAVAEAYREACNTRDDWWFAYWCTKFAGLHMSVADTRKSIVNVCVDALMACGSHFYHRLTAEEQQTAHTVQDGIALVVVSVPPEARRTLLLAATERLPSMNKKSVSHVADLVLDDLYRHLETADLKLDGGYVWREGDTLFIAQLARDFRHK